MLKMDMVCLIMFAIILAQWASIWKKGSVTLAMTDAFSAMVLQQTVRNVFFKVNYNPS